MLLVKIGLWEFLKSGLFLMLPSLQFILNIKFFLFHSLDVDLILLRFCDHLGYGHMYLPKVTFLNIRVLFIPVSFLENKFTLSARIFAALSLFITVSTVDPDSQMFGQ